MPSSSSSSSSPATAAGQRANGHGSNANSNGQGSTNGTRNSGRAISALAAALVGGPSHARNGHNDHNGNGHSHPPHPPHPHSHVVHSQPHHPDPHSHSHPPYPYPQQPLQSAQQHYVHLAAVAAAAAAAAAASAASGSSASSSSSSLSSSRSRRSAPKTAAAPAAAAQSTDTQLQQTPAAAPAIPKPIRRRTHNPNVPRAEWTSDRDDILFDVLTLVEAAKPPSERGSWSVKHWASVAQSLGERGIPGNGQQRYAVLRRDWRTLCELLKKPGFAWDEVEGKVTASDEVWEAHLNSLSVPFHKLAATRLREKPYPHYQRAKTLWGLEIKDGPAAASPTVDASAALAAASRSAFTLDNGRPHTPESPPTTISYNEGSLPPGAVAASAAGDSSSSSHHHHHQQQHTPERPAAAAAGMQQQGVHQHQQHQLQHHSDLDFLRSPSRDDSILSAQELSDLMGSVPTPTRSESMMPPPPLHFDPPPPPASHPASFIPPPLIPYPLGSPTLSGPSTNTRKRHAPPPPPPTSSSHPHAAAHPHTYAAKRHKPDVPPPPPFTYHPGIPHATSHAHAHAVYAQPALPLHASDPVYRAVSAAAALAAASSASAPHTPDAQRDTTDPVDPTATATATARRLSSSSAGPPGPPPVPLPSLADSMALAMAWLAGQRAAAGGVDAGLMLSAAHVFMEDERVLYMFLALPEDLRVVFLRQRVEAGGEAAGGGEGVDGGV